MFVSPTNSDQSWVKKKIESSFWKTIWVIESDFSEEGTTIAHYTITEIEREKRRFWVHAYIERNFHRRLLIAGQSTQSFKCQIFVILSRVQRDICVLTISDSFSLPYAIF